MVHPGFSKKLIKQVGYRLKFLQARKTTIVVQTRQDIAKLLQIGDHRRASVLVRHFKRLVNLSLSLVSLNNH